MPWPSPGDSPHQETGPEKNRRRAVLSGCDENVPSNRNNDRSEKETQNRVQNRIKSGYLHFSYIAPNPLIRSLGYFGISNLLKELYERPVVLRCIAHRRR